MLKVLNYNDRDKEIYFEEEGHIYTVLGRTDYTSCTGIVHACFPCFDANSIIDKILSSRKMLDPNYRYYGKTKEDILMAWEVNRNESASQGTSLHADIEKYYNGDEVQNSSIEYGYFQNFLREHAYTAYRTEWEVYYEEFLACGSIDFVAKDLDGNYIIFDWKRSKKIEFESAYNKYSHIPELSHLPHTNYYHYSIQLNLYKRILEVKYAMKIHAMFLIVLHSNNKNYRMIEVNVMSKEIDFILSNFKKLK